tara:strand:+ start:1008 stop:2108 length:1101 start_codon:yes stop_codon:yes gene_type:complete
MKKNLIFFLARFGKGGAGNSIFKLCCSLDQKKYNIFVICMNNCAYKKEFLKAGIKVKIINSRRAFFAVFYLKKIILKIIENNAQNYLISNINYTNLLCSIFIKKENNLKFIAVERTPFKELEIYFSLIDRIKKVLIKSLIPIFYKKFDLIICNSEHLGKYLKKKYGIFSKTLFPPSITDFRISKKKYKRKKSKKSKIKLITVCRLSKEKNIYEIIQAISKVKKKISLDIIGDGPEKNNIYDFINSLNLKKKIKLIGFKKNPYNHLIKADLYINSSYFEGFPNSVVEAAHVGLPIIASQSHGGINEILSGGKGGTIYKNSEDLKKSIEEFVNNPQKFINKSKITQKKILEFSLKNHVNNFNKMLNDI